MAAELAQLAVERRSNAVWYLVDKRAAPGASGILNP
jgi:hypothetical protein